LSQEKTTTIQTVTRKPQHAESSNPSTIVVQDSTHGKLIYHIHVVMYIDIMMSM